MYSILLDHSETKGIWFCWEDLGSERWIGSTFAAVLRSQGTTTPKPGVFKGELIKGCIFGWHLSSSLLWWCRLPSLGTPFGTTFHSDRKILFWLSIEFSSSQGQIYYFLPDNRQNILPFKHKHFVKPRGKSGGELTLFNFSFSSPVHLFFFFFVCWFAIK